MIEFGSGDVLEVQETRGGIRESLGLLLNDRFGSFWLGSLLSNIGTWMQQVAEPWLILSLSGSSLLLGIDAFAMDAPVWALTLLGGVLADRSDRRRVIFLFQALQMFCPITLVILLWMGRVQVWMVIALSVIVGITDALSMPAFQSIIPSMVESKKIGTALALNSTQFNLSRILGPALAGLLMARFGPTACFGANASSYIPLLLCVYWVVPKTQRRLKSAEPFPDSRPLFSEIRQIGRDRKLRGALLTVLTSAIFCGPLITFTPVIVKELFLSDVGHFGGAVAAFGIGGILGASFILGVDGWVSRIKLASAGAILYGVLLLMVSLNRSLIGLDILLVAAGGVLTISNTSANSLLQYFTPDRMRGQTASLYMLAMRGGLSLGNLFTGISVSRFGVSHALFVNGCLAVLFQLLIFRFWSGSTPRQNRDSEKTMSPIKVHAI